MTDHQPFLSIIVLCYNVEEFIDRCLRSIYEQSFTDLEVIVVDDGSTDGSGRIADQWQKRDARFQVFHKKNENIVAARKFGLKKARGAYIGAVDGDDWIDADMYETLCGAAMKHEADVVQCSMYMNARSYIIGRPHPHPEGLYSGKRYEDALCMRDPESRFGHMIQNTLCSKIIRRDILYDALMGMDDSCVLGEDAIASLVSAAMAKRHYQVKKCLYHYRVREGSRTHSSEADMLDRLCALSRYGKEKINSYMPKLLPQVDARIRTFIMMTAENEQYRGALDEKRKAYWKRMLKQPPLQAAIKAPLLEKEKHLATYLVMGILARGDVPPLGLILWMDRQNVKKEKKKIK